MTDNKFTDEEAFRGFLWYTAGWFVTNQSDGIRLMETFKMHNADRLTSRQNQHIDGALYHMRTGKIK